MQERILTPSQVAQILQIHQFTVLKYIKQGKIKASKIGRVYRIRESDLEKFLDQSQSNSPKIQEEGDQNVSKSKNKNKKLKKTKKLAESSGQESQEIEVTVSKVDMIETSSEGAKLGGDDEYYILR